MRAQQLSFMILCIVISMGIVNYWGGFSSINGNVKTNVSDGIAYEGLDPEKEGITSLNSGTVTDAEDLANDATGYSMIIKSIYGVYELLKYLAYPYGFLVSNGVPIVISLGVQTLFNAVEGLGLIQLWRGVGFKIFD